MRLRSSGIINSGTAREVSGRAEAHARRKFGVFAFGSALFKLAHLGSAAVDAA